MMCAETQQSLSHSTCSGKQQWYPLMMSLCFRTAKVPEGSDWSVRGLPPVPLHPHLHSSQTKTSGKIQEGW